MYWVGLFITTGDVLIALAITSRYEPDKTRSAKAAK
jgi:hypothetical protein